MTTVLVETSDALPLVSVAIAFRGGAACDPPGQEGAARLCARMLRRGAGAWSADQIEDRLDLLGGELSASASLSASTLHFEVILRSLEPFADLVATLLAEPRFEPSELGRLCRKTQAEIVESRDSDRSLASRAFRMELFGDHPYGRRIAGSIASLPSIRATDLRRFFQEHYRRDEAVVAVSGPLSVSAAEALAERLLSGLPASAEGRAPTADLVPEPTMKPGKRLVIVEKAERSQTQLVVGSLGTSAHDPDHVPLLVGNTALGGTFTSRLMNEVRVQRGWSYGASSSLSLDRRREAFSMWTAPAEADAGPCLELELRLLSELRRDGVDDDELAFVKGYLVRSHAFDIDTPKKRVLQRLEEKVFDLPEGYFARYLERVGAVTRDETNAAVAKRLPDGDLVVAVVGSHETLEAPLVAAMGGDVTVKRLPIDFE